MLKAVLQLFLEDVPGRIERLRAAWQVGNAVEVQRSAHSLKGSAGNMGASLDAEYARVEAEIARVIGA